MLKATKYIKMHPDYHFPLRTEVGMTLHGVVPVCSNIAEHMVIGSIRRAVGDPEGDIRIINISTVMYKLGIPTYK